MVQRGGEGNTSCLLQQEWETVRSSGRSGVRSTQETRPAINLKGSPQDLPPPVRSTSWRFNKLPKHQHPPETKCSDTCTYETHFTSIASAWISWGEPGPQHRQPGSTPVSPNTILWWLVRLMTNAFHIKKSWCFLCHTASYSRSLHTKSLPTIPHKENGEDSLWSKTNQKQNRTVASSIFPFHFHLWKFVLRQKEKGGLKYEEIKCIYWVCWQGPEREELGKWSKIGDKVFIAGYCECVHQ